MATGKDSLWALSIPIILQTGVHWMAVRGSEDVGKTPTTYCASCHEPESKADKTGLLCKSTSSVFKPHDVVWNTTDVSSTINHTEYCVLQCDCCSTEEKGWPGCTCHSDMASIWQLCYVFAVIWYLIIHEAVCRGVSTKWLSVNTIPTHPKTLNPVIMSQFVQSCISSKCIIYIIPRPRPFPEPN